MRDLTVSFIVGLGIGIVFAVMKLPVPAPANLAGVVGVFGLFLGYKIVRLLL